MALPPWLLVWMLRYACGERFRKVIREEMRLGATLFFLSPLYIIAFVKLGRPVLDQGSGLAVWLLVVASLAVLWVITWLCEAAYSCQGFLGPRHRLLGDISSGAVV